MSLEPRNAGRNHVLMRLLPLLLVLLVPFATANSELPSLGETSSTNIARETLLGRSVYERLYSAGFIETEPLLDNYINELGFRLLAGLDERVRDYRFFIVRDNAVNAFALPGGYIGINQGLIRYAQTQHQLASVMAHEIAHVRLMHGMDMLRKSSEINSATLLTMLAGLLLGSVNSEVGSAVLFGGAAGGQQAMVNFTRENEYEADRIGIELLYDAGFDTNGTVEFFTIMTRLSGSSEFGNIEYLRTHPLGTNRIAEAIDRVQSHSTGSDQIDDFQLFKDYLVYTASDHLPDQGSDYQRALAAMRSADYERADQLLGELYQSNNENMFYSLSYAENLERLERSGEAEGIYRSLLLIYPGDYVISLRLLALLSFKGDYEAALEIARQLEVDYPTEQRVYFALSDIYKSLNQPALQWMAEAKYHELNGNITQAIRLYDKVLALPDARPATLSKAREKRLQVLE